MAITIILSPPLERGTLPASYSSSSSTCLSDIKGWRDSTSDSLLYTGVPRTSKVAYFLKLDGTFPAEEIPGRSQYFIPAPRVVPRPGIIEFKAGCANGFKYGGKGREGGREVKERNGDDHAIVFQFLGMKVDWGDDVRAGMEVFEKEKEDGVWSPVGWLTAGIHDGWLGATDLSCSTFNRVIECAPMLLDDILYFIASKVQAFN
ncbi:hypothetical protein B9Z19DRAFT_1065520 [Tuber borchii]|uniref:Uncharacterized protein n=1 Tax=Tuber borchii TaxID=42251 RepID=A0A2T6ZQS6_TUBBO|nr:hypothetical protein B9Z19DRAFT_1065520 [Tuber borchii]